MKKLIVPALLLLAACFCYSAQAQTITGTWQITRTGIDPETMTNAQLGNSPFWIIKETANQVTVESYLSCQSGSIISGFNLIVGVSYKEGVLYVASAPPPSPTDAFIKTTTYYTINLPRGSKSASGSYQLQSLMTSDISANLGAIMGVPMPPPQPTFAGSGTISLVKTSSSVIPPKSTYRPQPTYVAPPIAPTFPSLPAYGGFDFLPPPPMFVPSAPMFVPSAPTPFDFSSTPTPSFGNSGGRSSADCSIKKINCRRACDAPTYGIQANADRKYACWNSCDAEYSACKGF